MSYSQLRTTIEKVVFVKVYDLVKLGNAAQFIWIMPCIFHLIFSKLIKSSVPYFSIVCDLFTLFYYSHCFCGLFTF